MTHYDIYTKFMIEYDKANVTSSYPSLTEYEVATILDKAYNALIAQKVTGNNVRRTPFESDMKAIMDIAPLVKTSKFNRFTIDEHATNVYIYELPPECLYFINASYLWDAKDMNGKEVTPYDNKRTRRTFVKLINHDMATKFIASSNNIPWVKDPVCYIEDNLIYMIFDIAKKPSSSRGTEIDVTYIKKPNTFVKETSDNSNINVSFFDSSKKDDPKYQFECNDTVAEELISLAIVFALENVESQRLSSKLNIRGLEA